MSSSAPTPYTRSDDLFLRQIVSTYQPVLVAFVPMYTSDFLCRSNFASNISMEVVSGASTNVVDDDDDEEGAT